MEALVTAAFFDLGSTVFFDALFLTAADFLGAAFAGTGRAAFLRIAFAAAAGFTDFFFATGFATAGFFGAAFAASLVTAFLLVGFAAVFLAALTFVFAVLDNALVTAAFAFAGLTVAFLLTGFASAFTTSVVFFVLLVVPFFAAAFLRGCSATVFALFLAIFVFADFSALTTLAVFPLAFTAGVSTDLPFDTAFTVLVLATFAAAVFTSALTDDLTTLLATGFASIVGVYAFRMQLNLRAAVMSSTALVRTSTSCSLSTQTTFAPFCLVHLARLWAFSSFAIDSVSPMQTAAWCPLPYRSSTRREMINIAGWSVTSAVRG